MRKRTGGRCSDREHFLHFQSIKGIQLPHVQTGTLNPPAAVAVPFPLFNNLPHYQNGTIPIGSEFFDMVLDVPVTDTANCLVILNASSCIVPDNYDQTGEGDIAIDPGTGVGTLTNLSLLSTTPNQSEGAWYDWVDETTIRIHRGGGECTDCFGNCVNFSVQILEFLPGMFSIPV